MIVLIDKKYPDNKIKVYDDLITGVFGTYFLSSHTTGACTRMYDLDKLVNDFKFPKDCRIVSFMFGNKPDLKIETY